MFRAAGVLTRVTRDTHAAGPMSFKVRSAEVPIVDDQTCTARITGATEKLFILPASSFCAGGSDGNDACRVRVSSHCGSVHSDLTSERFPPLYLSPSH